jgi:hypothetical protein
MRCTCPERVRGSCSMGWAFRTHVNPGKACVAPLDRMSGSAVCGRRHVPRSEQCAACHRAWTRRQTGWHAAAPAGPAPRSRTRRRAGCAASTHGGVGLRQEVLVRVGGPENITGTLSSAVRSKYDIIGPRVRPDTPVRQHDARGASRGPQGGNGRMRRASNIAFPAADCE